MRRFCRDRKIRGGRFPIRSVSPLSLKVLLLIFVLCPPLVYCFHRVQMDDPYITFRYARNLTEGHGLFYNPGESVLGTTSPLFAILLGLGGHVARDYALLSSIVSGVALGALAWLTYIILRRFKEPIAGAVAAGLIITNPLMGDALGFELNLFLALVFGGFAAYFSGRPGLAAALLALASLTRGDGLVPSGVVLGHHLWKHREQGLLPVLIFGAIFGSWFADAAYTYGSPFPNTLAAKKAMGASGLWRTYIEGALRIGFVYLRMSPAFLWFGLVAIFGAAALLVFDRRIWMILGSVLLTSITYVVMGIPEGFNYYAGWMPALMILSGIGVVKLAELIRLQWPAWPGKWVVIAAALPLLVAQMTPILKDISIDPEPRYEIYRQAGEWLNLETPDKASIAMVEIGILGYFSRRKIVDICGLVTPEVGSHLTSRDVSWSVRTLKPDYVILHDPLWTTLEGPIGSAGWFQEDYTKIKTFDGEEPYILALYQKRNLDTGTGSTQQ
jgi:arabinofuranosyltransferase